MNPEQLAKIGALVDKIAVCIRRANNGEDNAIEILLLMAEFFSLLAELELGEVKNENNV